MPIQVQWQDEAKTILTYVFTGRWTADEFHLAMDEVVKMLSGWQGSRLDVISDLSNSKAGGFGMQSGMLSAVRRSEKIYPPEFGLSYIVGAPRWIDISLKQLKILMPFMDTKVNFAASIDEAVTTIKNEREKVK